MTKTTAATVVITLATAFSLFPFPFSLLPKSSYHSLFLSLSDDATIARHLYTLTRRPHVAGSDANADAAEYVLSTFSAAGAPSHVASYEVLLTYPTARSLELAAAEGETPERFELRQEVYAGDPYADVADQVLPTFHAYAKSGTVSGPVIYVNYGRVEDFAKLNEMGANVTGAIALARYGRIFRGDIVWNAYYAGAIGVVIYTDRKDYGGGGGSTKWFPDNEWMPPTGVQVGSVYTGAGDPTTPGWASTGQCERLSDDEVADSDDIPQIPSLPVSWADGEKILGAIGGNVADEDWQGGVDAPVYKVGPGPGVLELSYEGRNVISTIQNVIGVIEGREEPDRYVILGNHRDAWTFGAVDPNSGTAALLEIGSTEWVEENREMLSTRVVAYLNVDSGVAGPNFQASATPQLDELIKQSAQKVQDPDNTTQTIYEAWLGSSINSTIGRLGGAGSDYSAFVQHIGVPSADMSFGEGYPVYHSMYDDFVWMQKFGDPKFQRHVAVASIWGFIALRLADEEILPFNYLSYAHELEKSAEELKRDVSEENLELDPLFKSIEKLKKAATEISHQKKELEKKKGWVSWWKKEGWKVRELNNRLMMTERAFTDRDGLSGRPWYKHLIYAPSKHNDYGSKCFPGIDDEIEKAESLGTSESWRTVQHEVWRVARAITHASLVLNGKLT